jgi:hypothetical protein
VKYAVKKVQKKWEGLEQNEINQLFVLADIKNNKTLATQKMNQKIY